jgi:alcohol dehydrogenase class IV
MPHAETNAAMLPHTLAAMRERAPGPIGDLAEAIGTAPGGIGQRIESLAGGPWRLTDLGMQPGCVHDAVSAMLERPELGWIPDPPDRAELEALVAAAA